MKAMTYAAVEPVTTGTFGTPRYFQVINGWIGSGFDHSYRTIDGAFIAASGCANIQFSVTDFKKGRRYEHHGSIVLSERHAIEFATSLLPPELRDVVLWAQEHEPKLFLLCEYIDLGYKVLGIYKDRNSAEEEMCKLRKAELLENPHRADMETYFVDEHIMK